MAASEGAAWVVCGDGVCTGAAESPSTCAADCSPATRHCLDGVCNADESVASCEADCGSAFGAAYCGDGLCTPDEGFVTCAADCAPESVCGDGVCDSSVAEGCSTCAQDCLSCPVDIALPPGAVLVSCAAVSGQAGVIACVLPAANANCTASLSLTIDTNSSLPRAWAGGGLTFQVFPGYSTTASLPLHGYSSLPLPLTIGAGTPRGFPLLVGGLQAACLDVLLSLDGRRLLSPTPTVVRAHASAYRVLFELRLQSEASASVAVARVLWGGVAAAIAAGRVAPNCSDVDVRIGDGTGSSGGGVDGTAVLLGWWLDPASCSAAGSGAGVWVRVGGLTNGTTVLLVSILHGDFARGEEQQRVGEGAFGVVFAEFGDSFSSLSLDRTAWVGGTAFNVSTGGGVGGALFSQMAALLPAVRAARQLAAPVNVLLALRPPLAGALATFAYLSRSPSAVAVRECAGAPCAVAGDWPAFGYAARGTHITHIFPVWAAHWMFSNPYVCVTCPRL